ncbi:transcription initiation factor TFIID subunit 13-like [Lacerta agilis]|uniref:transcription initiation factor TFIID subunit 13-like n=1 Tax=Lacerta agilis TaxID=80427 RepID=UPI00141A342F|nr:transcription initiation factor TFIID subunit 13-like [Lacerta agilis]
MADEEEDPPFEEDTEEAGGGPDGGQGGRKRLFSKELRCMMYGFGDDQNPYTKSVNILEDLVIEFITEMTHKAMSIGWQSRVQVEDIVFLIRKDPQKFARVKDLLTMNEEPKRARKAFDEATVDLKASCDANGWYVQNAEGEWAITGANMFGYCLY